MATWRQIGDEFSPALWRARIVESRRWLKNEGRWFAISVVTHAVILLSLLFIVMPTPTVPKEATFEVGNLDNALSEPELAKFELGKAPLEPTVLNTEALTQLKPPSLADASAAQPNAAAAIGGGGGLAGKDALGGLGGLDISAVGSGAMSKGGGLGGGGAGDNIGAGGGGTGFGGRGQGLRKTMLGGFGGTKDTERAVAGGINWLVRHQNANGSWSIDRIEVKVAKKGKAKKQLESGGEGFVRNDTAGTAMALLPFLAANETHRRGGFRKTVGSGLAFLTSNQAPDGCYSPGPVVQPTIYAHALATIVVCEAYGLTKDRGLRSSAQKAVRFIEGFQHPKKGGWRYLPRDEMGDTSVFGWCVMALKSAQIAGLDVRPQTLELAKLWLKTNARGKAGGVFPYLGASDKELEERYKMRLDEAKANGDPPEDVVREQNGTSPTRSAIGVLCLQYLGEKPTSANIKEGIAEMMGNLPTARGQNFYYWYYATQVVHNVPGTDWDRWNRQMRRVLIESQVKSGDNEGSWSPGSDFAERIGGRLMCTSFGSLILEVYYRYLPLYRINADRDGPAKE